MTEEVVFYHTPRTRSAMVAWMLAEAGVPHRIVLVNMEAGENRQAEFLAVNPMGKVPVLVHGGVVVTETAAIIAYLAEAFPQAGLAPPAGDPRRGALLRWLVFGASCFEPALLDVMFKRPPIETKRAVGWGSYEEVVAALKGALDPGPYLLGAEFSAADVYVAAELAFAVKFGAPGIKEDAVLGAYIARCTARPAFARAMAG